ncbi:hypothetical protein Tco_0128201 [Tanacetum coccineum]
MYSRLPLTNGVSYDGPMIATYFPPHSEGSGTKKNEGDKGQGASTNFRNYRTRLTSGGPSNIFQSPIVCCQKSPNPKTAIPYPSRPIVQKLREKDNNQMLKFRQIFQRLHIRL